MAAPKFRVSAGQDSTTTTNDPRQLASERNAVIVKTSIIGIAANVLLAAFKAVVGLLSGSIAIVLDAVNNISDAASSIITIVGTKLAGKAPDKEHPFGYGRIEYMSAMIIAVIVLYAGITSLSESAEAIAHPTTPNYTVVSLVIVAVGVVVKVLLGRYVKATGERVNSDSLINSGTDARLDSVISASTLAAALLYLTVGVSLEAWLGAIISVVIIKSGIDMLRETISELLGQRADADLARAIRATVMSFPDVEGAYDLVLNNYGPDTWNGSIHIEVPDTYSASELDELIRQITVAVYTKHNVLLTAVGVYSKNTTDPHAIEVREKISAIVHANPYVLQMHGFYLEEEKKTIRFDIVVSFDAPDRYQVCTDAVQAVQAAFPDYKLEVALDTDFTEA